MLFTWNKKYLLKSELQSLFAIIFQDKSRNPSSYKVQIFVAIVVRVSQAGSCQLLLQIAIA